MYLSEKVTGKIPEAPASPEGTKIRAQNPLPSEYSEPWYQAAIADERAFLAALERLWNASWLDHCPIGSGQVILERAIALTRGRLDFLVLADRNDREIERRQTHKKGSSSQFEAA
jgi:hypothetical protein